MRQIVIPLNIIFLMNWLTLVLSEDPVLRYEVGKKKIKKKKPLWYQLFSSTGGTE